MITFDSVTKNFAGISALTDVSFCASQGSMHFVTGHSGAGKSTLLKLIMGLIKPSFGRVLVNNNNIVRLNKKAIASYRQGIGMILQDPMLLNEYNVFDNVALPLIVAGFKPGEQKRRVQAALYKVGLLNKAGSSPSVLSSGEQQRVSIARAIVNRPDILLADEPTGNLDPELSLEVLNLFKAFNQVGVTVLIATHEVNLIQQFDCPAVHLTHGKLTHLNEEATDVRQPL